MGGLQAMAYPRSALQATPLQNTTPIPKSSVDLADQLDAEREPLDPGHGGWDTELFASRAKDQLQEVES
ncbi:MAG: hypothetical protein ACI9F9_002272 [Candidatus Paceibacteria bacterium]|jgi:hypothetical protein